MDYSAMIQCRKSVRAFRDKKVSPAALAEIQSYYQDGCHRLIPDIQTELCVFHSEMKERLEGIAGYEHFMIGAPCYLLLLSDDVPYAQENAGYLIEDLVLKLTEMGLDSCWLTFANGDEVKQAVKLETSKRAVGLLAFGYGEKLSKKLRLNIRNMSKVDVVAKRQYYAQKVSLYDLVYLDQWGHSDGVEEHLGYFEDMLWRAFYAASLAPSYLNRQPYRFLLRPHEVVLVSTPDEYTDPLSQQLNLGIVMLHFAMVIAQWVGKAEWTLGAIDDPALNLPSDCTAVARLRL